ncbi:MAG: ABC transporter substrate-binding protein [Anaerolineae bacterium]
MAEEKRTRRDFLRLASLTTAGAVLAACAGEPEVVEKIVKETVIVEKEVEKIVTATPAAEAEATAEPAEEPTAAPTEPAGAMLKFSEAPMLAERVAAGELPPVEERLPEDPLVVEVLESIGQYGGTITVGSNASTLMGGDLDRVCPPINYLRIAPSLQGAVPSVFKQWQFDDHQNLTLELRKGVRWSDGEPVTADDVVFWYEDILLNTEITPLPAIGFRPGGEMMTLTKVDDYTVQITFSVPNPSFILVNLAHRYGFGNGSLKPAHYLKQFHIKYNDKAEELAKAAGLDFWYQLFGREANPYQTLDLPTLMPFMAVRDSTTTVFFERNPYFWMVDAEGNQLPYIDAVTHDRVADIALLDAKLVGGNYDFAGMQTNIQNYATYAEGADASDAEIVLWSSGKGSECQYAFNMNWEEDEWREVCSDDRFRQALSLAINRQEINDVIYFGNAVNRAMTVISASRHFKPEYAEAYIDYDPERANALLDEMGLEWSADKKHRLFPTSKTPMVIAFDFVETETPKLAITELVAEYWRNVGIEIQYKSITRNLLNQKILANQEMMSLWHGGSMTDILFLREPKFLTPRNGDESTWGVLWGLWYNTGGQQGLEPPELIKELYRALDDYNRTDSNESAAIVLRAQAEHIWNIGTVGEAPHPLWVRKNLKNVEPQGFWVWDALWTEPFFPEQWYIES